MAQAFPSSGARASPAVNDGINIARTVTNELDSARFDPLFVRSVAKNVVSSLDTLVSRADSLVRLDFLEKLDVTKCLLLDRKRPFGRLTLRSIRNTCADIKRFCDYMSLPLSFTACKTSRRV